MSGLLPASHRGVFQQFLVAALITVTAVPFFAGAQVAPPAGGAAPLVDMSFPPDGIDLAMLADIVTRRLHIPILYDEQVRGKKVILRVPAKVPESALMGILQSALRLKGLALVDAEEKGWKQIVPAPNLAAVAVPGNAHETDSPVAQVFLLNHADPTKIAELVRPFLTQPGGYLQAETGQKTLIVGDYPSVVRRVEVLIKQLDTDAPPVETRFISLKTASATALVTAVQQLINNRELYQWGNATASGISLTADEPGNQVIVIAPPARMDEVMQLIAGLDRGPQLDTRVYHLHAVSPDRVDEVVRGLVDPALLKRGYQVQLDHDSQTFVVAATPLVQAEIADLVKQLDVPVPQEASPIQFYKLKNSKAADLLSTIGGLFGDSGSGSTSQPSSTVAGYNNGPAGANGNGPTAALNDNTGSTGNQGRTAFDRTSSSNGFGATGVGSDLQNASPLLSPVGTGNNSAQPGVLAVHGHGATAMADVNSNSIIVIAPPAVQQMYADLIHRLDQRRPQVQIECTIVTLDTTNDTSVGVDIGKLGGFDGSQLLTLSSFGISSANPVTGRLTPTAGTGGTFALLSPRIADVVVRALETNSKARLVSAPKLLVNDNGAGKLQSVAQQPYAVILDASSTQSLTSLGGLAQAGTSISVEPHISDADYLQLTYSIELSNFTGDAASGLPPPSQKNSVDSEVTIPDGYTIVVGGLTSKNYTQAVNSIPILDQIPILKYAFGTRSWHAEDTTLFVFIRPTILRDDQFDDLKFISADSVRAAGLVSDLPQSNPVLMK